MRHAAALLLLLPLAWPGALLADKPKRRSLELFSQRGRRAEVKRFWGERLTFRVREGGTGLAGIFEPKLLPGVTFRLIAWHHRRLRAVAIADGFAAR